MSCYFRHMMEVLAEAGIEVTPTNVKAVDRAFHHIAGVPYKDCPASWKALKQILAAGESSRQDLARQLREAMGREPTPPTSAPREGGGRR
jgi:hypothetical protein